MNAVLLWILEERVSIAMALFLGNNVWMGLMVLTTRVVGKIGVYLMYDSFTMPVQWT